MSKQIDQIIAEAREAFVAHPMPLGTCLRLRALAASSSGLANPLFPEDAGEISNAGSLGDDDLERVLAGEALGGWALAASSLNLLSQLVLENEPTSVLEFGSGRSTVALAHLMKRANPDRTGPMLISVEQNETYLRETQLLLQRAGLDDVVRLFHAPIAYQRWGYYEGACYNLSGAGTLDELTQFRPELVVIDGPVGGYGIRFGTVPSVFETLADDALIIMDDALRDSELAIAQWWEELGYTQHGGVLTRGKGTYLARLGGRPRGSQTRDPIWRERERVLSEIHVSQSHSLPQTPPPHLPAPFSILAGTRKPPRTGSLLKVSVVIPTKDRPELLGRALDSLANQSYGNWEAVVVNDGGNSIRHVIEESGRRGQVINVERSESGGPAAARNSGLAAASGDIVTYLDDDDRYLPEHLATLVEAFSDDSVQVVYTEAEYVYETEVGGASLELSRAPQYSGIEYSRRKLLVQNFIPMIVLAHRKQCVEEVGPFDESFPALVDWEFFLRLSEKFVFHHIPKITVEACTRVDGSGNVSRSQRGRFPELFARVYARHGDGGDTWVKRQRDEMLRSLFSESALPNGVLGMSGESSKSQDAALYECWLDRQALKESDGQYMAERMILEWGYQPRFHLLVLHESGEEEALADTLDSLAMQLYRGWGLSVISAKEAPEGFADVPNIEWLTTSGDREEAANAVAGQSSAEWILRLEAGASLEPDALFSLADYSQKFPRWQVIYADEDRVSAKGERHDPRFKPDFNLDLLRSTPYMGPFIAIRRELLVSTGGYGPLGEATVYDLVFRALETAGESSIGHIAKVLFHRSDCFQRAGDEALESELCREVVRAHLERVGVQATVRPGVLPRTQDIEYALGGSPLVSVIVPTRDQARLLQACIDSLLSITRYPSFEVLIVDNGSTESAALEYLARIAERDRRVRVLRYEAPYSFSAINNFAASHAGGKLLLLLNNDTQVLHDDWMARMVGHALRPEVGAVGARLVFADGTIQHGGVVLGMTSTADHPEIGTPIGEPGYMGRLQVTQNYSAVTAACLMIRKDLFEQVGGMDEEHFHVLFNDVDLCLKLREAGYKNVWTPFATLVHHASVSLKGAADAEALERARRERESLQRKWHKALASDPAFNRNLSLVSQKVRVEGVLSPAWDPNFRDRPRILASALDAEGTGHYRVWGPLQALGQATIAQSAFLPPHGHGAAGMRVPTVAELERIAPDTLLIQQGYYDLFLEWLEQYRKFSGVFLVFGQDDNVLNVPERNPLGGRLIGDVERRIARALACCDRLVVTTEPLVEVYRKYIGDVRVVPNALDGSRWTGLESRRRAGRRPRVGWAGALQHLGDLEWLEPVLRALSTEVDWVFMGMCPENLRPYVREFHQAVSFEKYPATLAGLDLDLALAPLEMHAFNEAKSDLRILEYGVLGWPVIATDIYPYQGKPVTCLPNDPTRWIAAIRERVDDLDALTVEGERLREWVLAHRMLEGNLDSWARALFSDTVLREFGVIRSLAA